jgi:putative tricarboxylic transport membrane protein
MLRLKDPGAAAFGVALMAVSGAVWWACAGLRFGTPMRMGPGFMPVVLAWIGLGLGTANLLRALAFAGPRLEPWAWRAGAWVGAAVAAFMALRALGLIATVLVSVACATFASPSTRPGEAAAVAVFLAALCAGVFVIGLGLPIPLWPG